MRSAIPMVLAVVGYALPAKLLPSQAPEPVVISESKREFHAELAGEWLKFLIAANPDEVAGQARDAFAVLDPILAEMDLHPFALLALEHARAALTGMEPPQ